MIAYGKEIPLLIWELWGAHPCETHPRYTDYAGAGGKFTHILAHLRDLQARGLPGGYLPEPTNIMLVMVMQNVAWAEEFFRGMGLKVVTGSRYLGGVHWVERGRKELAGQESRRMGGVYGDPCRGFP